jgi:hypothetical protein
MLAAKRLATQFSAEYQMYGNGFSGWWEAKNQDQKKDLLMDVTNCSILLKAPSEEEISQLLHRPMPTMSRSLYDYNVQSLCASCECDEENCDHYFQGRLLHEMADWAKNTEKKDQQNIDLSIEYRNRGIFPDLFNGKLAFVRPPSEGELLGAPYVFSETAPASTMQEFRQHIEQGRSAIQFAMSRKLFSLLLFVKLFDEFQIKVRRVLFTYPYERLMGCGHCSRSCQAEITKVCSTCKVSWFCCKGCMTAARHMCCPLGGKQNIKVMFN